MEYKVGDKIIFEEEKQAYKVRSCNEMLERLISGETEISYRNRICLNIKEI
jgi:hypothetical protein